MSLLAAAFLLASSAVTALQAALDGSAAWTMDRRLAGSTRVLTTQGTVTCTAGEGIVWRVTRPFVSSVAMTTNAMVFVDEEGRREKPLDELPHYAELRRATDAFAAGDRTAFDAVFNWEETALPAGGWRLKLTPKVRAMRRLVAAVEVSGASLPTNVVLTAGDGGRSEIRFRELRREE